MRSTHGEIGSDGEGDGQFRMPSAIAVDSKGNVYTADEYLHRITVFDSSGLIHWPNGASRGPIPARSTARQDWRSTPTTMCT